MAEIEIWTDGGCSPNPGTGAWAYMLKSGERSKTASGRMAGIVTNNRAELQAVIEALQALRNGPHTVTLYTDSEQVRLAIVGMRKPKKNLDQLRRIRELCQMHTITVHRIAGHAGIANNERCDQLATAAIGG